jgi:hypothetical protein
MDADNRFIPVVEDDQGEGYKDLLDFDEWPEEVKKAYRQSLKKQEKKSMAILSKKLNK